MDALTSADIRERSALDFERYGYPVAEPDPLDQVLASAEAYVLVTVGWKVADVPPELAPVMTRVLRMRVAQEVVQEGEDVIEAAGEMDVIPSFTAGAYSETRAGPGATTTASSAATITKGAINTWPALNELLWMLLRGGQILGYQPTTDLYAYWEAMFGAPVAPYWRTEYVDWAQRWTPWYDWQNP